jgi:hypothetical protein
VQVVSKMTNTYTVKPIVRFTSMKRCLKFFSSLPCLGLAHSPFKTVNGESGGTWSWKSTNFQ